MIHAQATRVRTAAGERPWSLAWAALLARALVYFSLSTALLAVYAAVVTITGALARGEGSGLPPLFATLLVALSVRPVHARIQRFVNRVLYGDRDEPYVALARLGQQLESTLTANAVLPTIVRGITEALRVPHAALAVRGTDGVVLKASQGIPAEPTLRLPVVFQNETLGELSVSPRAPGEPFSTGDRRLLQDLARHAGVAAHAVVLAADLERSRLRRVLAREDARRRLGSDLRDGLGHRLAGLLRATERISNVVDTDPRAARYALDELSQQTRSAIQEVRELAHTLHPPELDLLGLVGALREQADRHSGGLSNGLRVIVEAPAELPALPAAVEIATYVIACEALTNVERHARASKCTLRIAVAHSAGVDALDLSGATRVLQLEVEDDGRGLDTARTGLGLTTIRERAVELGGTCTFDSVSPHGARVRIRIPCVASN